MTAVIDSTVIIHLSANAAKMKAILAEKNITSYLITRINYLEILAGASENAKLLVRKSLQQFPILEFNQDAVKVANNLSMKYRVGKNQSKDFLIAAICIANKLPIVTENRKDFSYKELNTIGYSFK